jgi:signal peptidase I
MTEDADSPAPAPSRHHSSPVVAVLYTLLSPGLGLIYVGRLLAGLCVNLLFVLATLLFVVFANVIKFFPVYPALVLVAAWVVLCALAAWRSVEIIAQEKPHTPKPYQHPLMYALLAVLTFAAPLAVTAQFTANHLFGVAVVDSLVMYPQARPGDRLLIDKTVYRADEPARGDLVAVRIPSTGELAILRVIGVPSDQIQMHGHTLIINDSPVEFAPLNPEWISLGELDDDLGLQVLVEHNHDRRYVVAMSSRGSGGATVTGLELGKDTYFVLADNRSALADEQGEGQTDSRTFGPISRDHIEGRPLYIAWSYHPDTGSPRWNRIGLPTE